MIQEMEKLQAKGEVGEEEMRALEIDVTGKVSDSIWAFSATQLCIDLFPTRLCWHHGVEPDSRWSKYSEKLVALSFSTSSLTMRITQVCDHVLKDREASDVMLLNRAKVGKFLCIPDLCITLT